MASYLIRYLNNRAQKKQIEVKGNTKVSAIEESGINPEQILSVNLTVSFDRNELPLEIQELIVSEIRALARSGQAMNKGLARILRRSGVSKKMRTHINLDDGRTISKILGDIGVNKAVTAVVSAGENSSNLDVALDNCLSYLQYQKKVREQVKAPFIEGIVVISLALIMIMLVPKIVAPALKTLTSGTLRIDSNFMTDLLIFIDANNGLIWLGLFLIIFVIFILRKQIWAVAQNVPVLSSLDEFFILKRSVLLLMVLRPLFESGIPLNKSLKIIKSSMTSATDIKAMDKLIYRMSVGDALSRAVADKKYWSPIFFNSFATFEQAILVAQLELIDTVVHALLSRLNIISHQISIRANLMGKTLGFFALIMLIMGYYFPSLTANIS